MLPVNPTVGVGSEATLAHRGPAYYACPRLPRLGARLLAVGVRLRRVRRPHVRRCFAHPDTAAVKGAGELGGTRPLDSCLRIFAQALHHLEVRRGAATNSHLGLARGPPPWVLGGGGQNRSPAGGLRRTIGVRTRGYFHSTEPSPAGTSEVGCLASENRALGRGALLAPYPLGTFASTVITAGRPSRGVALMPVHNGKFVVVLPGLDPPARPERPRARRRSDSRSSTPERRPVAAGGRAHRGGERHGQRPAELVRALAACCDPSGDAGRRQTGSSRRDAAFLLNLKASGVRFTIAEMPEANELTVDLLAVLAQHDGGPSPSARRRRSPRRSEWGKAGEPEATSDSQGDGGKDGRERGGSREGAMPAARRGPGPIVAELRREGAGSLS